MIGNARKVFAISSLCTGCRTCEIACAVAHSTTKSLAGAILEIPLPRYAIEVQPGEKMTLPLNCRHCEEPDCFFACKAGAVIKDGDSGQVRVDLDKCVGCWMCVMVCPFGAARSDADRGKVVKCDLCVDRPEGPACAEACPTKALFFGTAEEFYAHLKEIKGRVVLVRSA